MTRKKRKGARAEIQPSAGKRIPGKKIPAHSAWDMLRFSPVPGAPLRAWFWPVLGAGLALRIFAALAGDFTLRQDEIFQIQEQAHRLVYGYGLVPWEFAVGMRSWLTVLPAAIPLALAKWVGWVHPGEYATAAEIFHALISLSVPVGMFFFARSYYGEAAARAALVLGCFWHEFVIFAPRALSEFYGTYFIFGALAALAPRPGAARALSVGLLLGFGLVMRPHYAPIVLGAAAAWIFALSRRSDENPKRTAAWGIGGGAIAALAFLATDWATWGAPGHSLWMNYQANVTAKVGVEEEGRARHIHLMNMLHYGAGAGLLALAAGLARWRRHGLVLALALSALPLHLLYGEQIYSLIFAIVCLLALIVAAEVGWALDSGKLRGAGVAASLAVAVAAYAGYSGQLSLRYKHFNSEQWEVRRYPLFLSDPYYPAGDWLSRLSPGELGGVIGDGWEGPYYRMHAKVPIYNIQNPEHAELLKGRDWREVATHVVSPRNLEGLELAHRAGAFNIYKTGGKPAPPLPGHKLNLSQDPITDALVEHGVISAPPEPIRLPE